MSTSSLLEQLRALERGHLPSSPLASFLSASGADVALPPTSSHSNGGAKRVGAGGKKAALPGSGGGAKVKRLPPPAAAAPPEVVSMLSSGGLRSLLRPQEQQGAVTLRAPDRPAAAFSAQSALTEQITEMQRALQQSLLQRQELSSKLLDSIPGHEQRINKGIWDSVHFLPTKLLIKHGKQEYVQGRALEMWRDLWRRRELRLMQDAVCLWWRFIEDERNTGRKQAGSLIVRIARGFLGRLRMRAHRRQLDDANVRKQRLAAIQGMGRAQRVVIIQRFARRVAAKLRVLPLLRRHRASLRIQRFFKTMHVIMVAKNNLRRRRLQDVASRLLQRVARGFLGRRRFKRARRAARHRAIQARLADPESTYAYYFEQAGAATRIQRWWRKLPSVYRAAWRHKYWDYFVRRKEQWLAGGAGGGKGKFRRRKKKKTGQALNPAYTAMLTKQLSKKQKRLNIATALNPIVRGFLGRMRVERLRVQRAIDQARRERCATLIQAHVRRLLIYARLPTVGPRTRAWVRKLRRWSRKKPVKPMKLRLLPLVAASGTKRPKEWADVTDQVLPLSCDPDWLAMPEGSRPSLSTRRGGVSYSNIRIPTAKTVARMQQAVASIVAAFRRMKARRILSALRGNRHLFAAARMQRWQRVCVARRRCLRLRALLLPLFERCVQRRSAARRIQRRFKVYLSTRWLTRVRYLRKVGVFRIQRLMRRALGRMRRKHRLAHLRGTLEVRRAGAEQFRSTELFTQIDFIWQGAKKTRTTDVPHDMQKFYLLFCTGSMIDMSQAGRLAYSAGIIDKKDLDIQTFESQFGKVKAPTEKRMDYGRWLELLANLGAIKLLGLSASLLKGVSNDEYEQGLARARAGAGGDEGDGKSPAELEAEAKIKAYRFGRYSGRTALIMKMTWKYLVPTGDWKKAAQALGKKSAAVLAAKHLKDCVDKCQRFARNRLAVKDIDRRWRALKAFKLRRRADRHATKIQTLIRHFIGRRRITRMAQALYSKYIDDETEAVYWYNPRTGSAFWTKPKLLGALDCGMPIRMPPEDEQYVVTCFSCQEKTASTYCDECDFAYCASCFTVAHRAGKRKGHSELHLDMCVQCDFQVGTKECVQCQDLFCESCYKNVHAKGRLRLHISRWVTDTCEECGGRAARWTQYEMQNNTGTYNWCVPCFRESHNAEPRVTAENSFFLRRYNFQGKFVREFRGKRDAENTRRQVALAYAERQKELAVLKTVRCATHIQRLWRGVRSRRAHANFEAERRAFFALREKQMPLRQNPLYKFLEFLGVAPSLQSDTMMEKVRHQYPSHMQDIVQECLRGQWREACRLQREQEEHLKKMGSPSLVQVYVAKMAVLNSTRLLLAAESVLKRRAAVLDVHKAKYRDARATSRTPAGMLKQLLSTAEQASSEVELAQALKEKRQDELLAKEQRALDFTGPRGLQKLVSRRRKEGVALPFTVTMIQGSTVALVHWRGSAAATAEAAGNVAPPSLFPPKPAEAEGNDGNDGGGAAAANDSLLTLAMGSGYVPGSAVVPGNTPGSTIAGGAGEGTGSGAGTGEGEPAPCPYAALGFRPPPPPDSPQAAQWRSAVRDFDTLLIQGMHFTALPPHFYEQAPGAEEAEAEEEERLRKVAAGEDEDGGGGGEEDEEGSGDEDDEDEEERWRDPTEALYPKIELSPAHIVLDRPWVFASVQDLPVYRAVPAVFFVRPLRSLGHALLASAVPQKGAAVAAITLHKLAQLNEQLAGMFDAESETGQWLRENARALEQRRDSVLRVSRSLVQVHTYDFSARRRLTNALSRQLKKGREVLQRLRRALERATGDPQAAGLSWEVWEQSTKKVEVEVYYETPPLHRGADPEQERIGTLHMDLEAPVPVLREYVQRACRDRLNALQGDSFLFQRQDDDGADVRLERDAEVRTYSKEYVPLKMDSKTMEAAYRVVLVPEPLEEGSAGTYIQEFRLKGKKHKAAKSSLGDND